MTMKSLKECSWLEIKGEKEMNGFQMMADSYKTLVKQGKLKAEDAKRWYHYLQIKIAEIKRRKNIKSTFSYCSSG